MGISRQAIYKWEADAALPEIDKLVSLSKLFGVSVGWLLGVEDEEKAEKVEENTMNQEQLDMVAQIVKRYMESQPKPKPRRKWPWVIAACVLAVLFVQLFSKMDRLSNQYTNLHNSVSNISSSVNSQIGSVAVRVEEILKAQNQLTAEFSTEIIDMDLAAGTVTLSMEAVPKTFAQGMGAVFVVDCGNGPLEFEGVLENGTTFSCEAEVELTNSITAYVVFIGFDGTRQTQVLDTYSWLLSDSFATLHIDDNELMWKRFKEGSLSFKGLHVSVWDHSPGKGDAQITEYRLGIFRNQKLLGWAEACDVPPGYIGDYSDTQFYQLPDVTAENLTEGDIITVAALVTDSFGRQYMCFEVPYEVELDEETGTGELSWVPAVEYSRDPADWIFE